MSDEGFSIPDTNIEDLVTPIPDAPEQQPGFSHPPGQAPHWSYTEPNDSRWDINDDTRGEWVHQG